MININMVKAKVIAHTARRAQRTEQFAPLDIQATIPAEAAVAEAARQVIRDANAAIQVAIDNAADDVVLKQVMATNSLV